MDEIVHKSIELISVFKRLGIFKNQFDNLLNFFEMIPWWIHYKSVEVQVTL